MVSPTAAPAPAPAPMQPRRTPLLARGDIDGFFGLAIDNVVNLIMIGAFSGLAGLSNTMIFDTVLPGAALSIAFGNLYYWRQARRLAAATGRSDVTALPYGINTPSLFAYATLIIIPVFALKSGEFQQAGHAAEQARDMAAFHAWRVGLVACLLSGVIEFAGAFIGERVRRATPRAALLSTLAGIALALISMEFILKVFHNPLYTFLPAAILLITYFGRVRFPFGVPGGLVTVVTGAAIAWWAAGDPALNSPVSAERVREAMAQVHPRWLTFCLPDFLDRDLWAEAARFLPIIIPMGVMNALGTLQNIESAAVAGDVYPTDSTMMANGLGSMLAAFFGSCYPTTVYIGHPGWKAMGARAGYSALTGVFIFALCVTGLSQVVFAVVPKEAGVAILLYIGLVIAAQAFQETPRKHAPAVALGFLPAIALWGSVTIKVFNLDTQIFAGGRSLDANLRAVAESGAAADPTLAAVFDPAARPHATALEFLHRQGFELQGILQLGSGFLFSAMVLTAILVFIIERRFMRAMLWALIGAALAAAGFIHSGYVAPPGEFADAVGFPLLSWFGYSPPAGVVVGWEFTVGYLFFAAALFAMAVMREVGVVADDLSADHPSGGA
ncbi:MAG: NCS2 family permease [Planctomycetes bacterium]|nr:NCS2 family permease [Planctomycetota bacterium]